MMVLRIKPEKLLRILLKTIQNLEKGTLTEIHQPSIINNNEDLQHAPKLFTETCEINWPQRVDAIYNFIRGLSPYPAAFTFLDGKKLKIFNAEKELYSTQNPPAEDKLYVTDHKSTLKFHAADGYIVLQVIQLEGKKKMTILEFLRGWRG